MQLTKQEILDRIRASPSILALVPNSEAIASELNKEQYYVPHLLGKGTILEKLGFEVGNAVCDLIDTLPNYRHIKHLLSEARLDLGVSLTREALIALTGQQIAPGVIFTSDHRDAVLGLALKNYSTSEYEVRCAIYNDDGSLSV